MFLNSQLIERILLIDPPSVSLMQYIEESEELFEMYEPLEIDQADFIFWPVNDNTDKFQESGGNHWALLVYAKTLGYFVYIDSGSGIDTTVFAQKLTWLIKNDQELTSDPFDVVELSNSPRQINSYDCGVYVLAMTKELLKIIKKSEFSTLFDANFDDITPEYVTELRLTIKDLAKSMIKSS